MESNYLFRAPIARWWAGGVWVGAGETSEVLVWGDGRVLGLVWRGWGGTMEQRPAWTAELIGWMEAQGGRVIQ